MEIQSDQLALQLGRGSLVNQEPSFSHCCLFPGINTESSVYHVGREVSKGISYFLTGIQSLCYPVKDTFSCLFKFSSFDILFIYLIKLVIFKVRPFDFLLTPTTVLF